jgi:hypothetical protein
MLEMVEARRNADKGEQRYDLFSGLLDAAQNGQDSEATLSDEELIGGIQSRDHLVSSESGLLMLLGNMFTFLVAGHEVRSFHSSCVVDQISSLQTTAHTLGFSFALLALYPDEQERLYQHIRGIMSSLNGTPVGSGNIISYRGLISP